jgi:hypothetical protein
LDAAPTDGNIGFRLRLQGEPALCGSGSASWAYISKSMVNYDATSSLLMTVYAMAKNVTIYANLVGGYCEIGYISVRD